MTKTKLLSAITAAAILILSIQTASAADTDIFTDVSETHPNYEAIKDLKDDGVIGGYPDGSFKPDQAVNRVEVLKMIFEGLEVEDPMPLELPTFPDTDLTSWYGEYLKKAYTLKMVEGYTDGTFKPDQTVNVVENLKLMLEAANVTLPTTISEDPYADAPKTEWYAKYVQYAKNTSLLDADNENKIYPAQGMTRGNFAETLFRLRNVLNPGQQNTENGEETSPVSEYTFNIKVENNKFTPDVITIGKGTSLKWTNLDSAAHTVTSDDEDFDSGQLSEDDTFTYKFDKLGTFDYHCENHPTMTGSVIVKEPHQVPTI